MTNWWSIVTKTDIHNNGFLLDLHSYSLSVLNIKPTELLTKRIELKHKCCNMQMTLLFKVIWNEKESSAKHYTISPKVLIATISCQMSSVCNLRPNGLVSKRLAKHLSLTSWKAGPMTVPICFEQVGIFFGQVVKTVVLFWKKVIMQILHQRTSNKKVTTLV